MPQQNPKVLMGKFHQNLQLTCIASHRTRYWRRHSQSKAWWYHTCKSGQCLSAACRVTLNPTQLHPFDHCSACFFSMTWRQSRKLFEIFWQLRILTRSISNWVVFSFYSISALHYIALTSRDSLNESCLFSSVLLRPWFLLCFCDILWTKLTSHVHNLHSAKPVPGLVSSAQGPTTSPAVSFFYRKLTRLTTLPPFFTMVQGTPERWVSYFLGREGK